MNTAPNKRALLFRRAQGKICAEEYARKLAYLLNCEISAGAFLDLEKTDQIIALLSKKKVCRCESVNVNCAQELFDFIEGKMCAYGTYVLLDEEWKFCGAYKLEGQVRFNHNFDFNKYLSDEIRIIDLSLRFQIQIDCDADEITCQYLDYD
ncbi:hypothetical protein ACMX25_17065 [Caballeronia sp. 15715]|uniref:hypothetical protein n=1 Tax=Caballeronia sp. 15715 TaxID=3391030 RepID=UPI0039E58C23